MPSTLEEGIEYKAQFKRTLGKFESFAVAFSFISITTGLFSTYGSILQSSGPAGIWTWPLVTLGTILVALVYGLLASRIPLSGYSYQWASRLGNPVLGWWFGWASFAFLAIVAVAVDYALSQVALFPLFNITYTTMNGAITTIIVILLQMILIIYSTPLLTKINNMAVGAEIVAIVGLIIGIGIAVFFFGKGNAGNLISHGVHHTHYYGWLGPFMLSALLGAYTLVGWESAANLAEETINPKKVVPLAMVKAILISGVLGTIFLAVITLGIGPHLEEVTNSSSPVADIISYSLGIWFSKVMLVVVSIAIFACGLVIMTSNSRLVHSMARDHRLPCAKLLSSVPRATGGPVAATLLCALVSILIVLGFLHNQDALGQLLGAGALYPALLYAGTVLLFIFTRKHFKSHEDDFKLGVWERPVIWGACIWLIIELSIFIFPKDFRIAQYYVLGSFILGGIIFIITYSTHKQYFVKS